MYNYHRRENLLLKLEMGGSVETRPVATQKPWVEDKINKYIPNDIMSLLGYILDQSANKRRRPDLERHQNVQNC